jgi:hypothetical protein
LPNKFVSGPAVTDLNENRFVFTSFGGGTWSFWNDLTSLRQLSAKEVQAEEVGRLLGCCTV